MRTRLANEHILCYAAFAADGIGRTRPTPHQRRLVINRGASANRASRIGASMADALKLAEVDRRISVVRENIRVLTEQAAAYSGAADEERNADRIAEQDALLTKLLQEREALAKG
jgi:hypothetical protein